MNLSWEYKDSRCKTDFNNTTKNKYTKKKKKKTKKKK